MNTIDATLLMSTVLLLSIGQVGQKIASRAIVPGARIGANIARLFRAPAFWVSGLLMAAATLCWLLLLTSAEISRVYPVLGANFAVTAVLSRLLLRERISARRWAGIGVLTVGAATMLCVP